MKRIKQTLSDIAAAFLTVDLPCGDCNSTGRQTNLRGNPLNPNEPFESLSACATCFGRGIRQAEVCSLCGQEESGCDRSCKRTTCCHKHPVDCVCPNGVQLYQQTYGLALAA
jgi:hypothetical protein